MKFDYDLIIIGSGSAGLAAAEYASMKNKKVAIAEKGRLGGECPNYACVPAKVFLKSAEVYRNLSKTENYGISVKSASFSWQEIMQRRNKITESLTGPRVEKILNKLGVDILRGEAKFLDSNSLQVDTKHYSAHSIIIATGSKAFIPSIPGLDKVDFLTSYDVNFLEKLPKSIAIIGSGPVGSEYGTMFASFGVAVTILERGENILGRLDEEIANIVQESLKEMGVKIELQTEVSKVEARGKIKRVYHSHGYVDVDSILIATGQKPNTEKLDADKAGVKLHEKRGHVIVDENLKSSQKNIYAAGDVSTRFMYTHVATYEGRIASHNAIETSKANFWSIDEQVIPGAIFTNPEVAQIGLTQQAAEEELGPENIVIGIYKIPNLGRGYVDGITKGVVKLIVKKKSKKILGAHIAGPRAGEMIHELAVVMQNNLSIEVITKTIHAFPTYAEGVRAAAVNALSKI